MHLRLCIYYGLRVILSITALLVGITRKVAIPVSGLGLAASSIEWFFFFVFILHCEVPMGIFLRPFILYFCDIRILSSKTCNHGIHFRLNLLIAFPFCDTQKRSFLNHGLATLHSYSYQL
jgi:hypothetical protein